VPPRRAASRRTTSRTGSPSDLGTTNGTVLAQPGLDAEELTPGIAVSLVPGAVLDLGDGVTIQVTNP
jgi:hypothetical protein